MSFFFLLLHYCVLLQHSVYRRQECFSSIHTCLHRENLLGLSFTGREDEEVESMAERAACGRLPSFQFSDLMVERSAELVAVEEELATATEVEDEDSVVVFHLAIS